MDHDSIIEQADKVIQEFEKVDIKIRYPKLFEKHSKLLKTQQKVNAVFSKLPMNYQLLHSSTLLLSSISSIPTIRNLEITSVYDIGYLQTEYLQIENQITEMIGDIEHKLYCIKSYTQQSNVPISDFLPESRISLNSISADITPSTSSTQNNKQIIALEKQVDDLEKELEIERKKSKQPRITTKSERLTRWNHDHPYSVDE